MRGSMSVRGSMSSGDHHCFKTLLVPTHSQPTLHVTGLGCSDVQKYLSTCGKSVFIKAFDVNIQLSWKFSNKKRASGGKLEIN